MNNNKTTVILSGGGLNGINICGYLYILTKNQNNILDRANILVTHSITTIIIFLYLIGYDFVDILFLWMTTDFKEYLKNISLYSIYKQKCLYDFEIELLLRRMLYKKTKTTTITLNEIYKRTNKNFVICVYNLYNKEVQYFDNTNDNIDAIKLISASCAIPLIFKPIEINEKLYCDPIITGNRITIPQHYLNDDYDNHMVYIKHILNTTINVTNTLNYVKIITHIIIENSMQQVLENTKYKFTKHEIKIEDDDEDVTIDIFNKNHKIIKNFDNGCSQCKNNCI